MGVQADEADEREQRLFDLAPPSDGIPPDSGRARGSDASFSAAMRRHPSFVLAPVLGLLALALLAGLARTPTYTASTRLAVGGLNATNPASFTGFADAAQQLAQTYSRSVQGDGVVGTVAHDTKTSPEEVRSHLSAAPIPETPVFAVTATSSSSDGAIKLSNLASQALVTEVDRASQADPARLLDEYRTAELERQQVSNRVNTLTGSSLAAAQAELLAAEARATSLRNAYEASQESGAVPLQVIQKADRASSDRLSVLQIRAFVAVVVGLILGMALALFRDTPSYEKTLAAIGSLRGRSPFKRRPGFNGRPGAKPAPGPKRAPGPKPAGGAKRAAAARASRTERAAARQRSSRRAET
jgi:capsular polysaccharide biosynthesis protein